MFPTFLRLQALEQSLPASGYVNAKHRLQTCSPNGHFLRNVPLGSLVVETLGVETMKFAFELGNKRRLMSSHTLDTTSPSLWTNLCDDVASKNRIFTRVLRVATNDLDMYKLDSNDGVMNQGLCSTFCKSDECRAFSYTTSEKRCDTYSREIDEEGTANVSVSTLYFSKETSSCSEVKSGSPSGLYLIYTKEGKHVSLFCDMDTAEGPWTVIQRRNSGNVDFYRNWTEYKNGFGDLNTEFWIGNDLLHLLTSTISTLRIELGAWDGTRGYAQYKKFQVANEAQNYRLSLQTSSGNVSVDALMFGNGADFSTYDRDNDKSSHRCAQKFHGAWWYKNCGISNLNGRYQLDSGDDISAMTWKEFPSTRNRAPLMSSTLLIK
ncbi:fibrinogen-like protein A [Ylistrum balloti]|uniref:fibrinogen-like protein A n=1 Tax=Ylistrum balloti TaxID=509963 RepID=UPI0029059F44|nr:fibrinogen-like protein A [Ylistrum balloti]